MYFGGSNTSNIKFASNAAFAVGTGDFTVEFWYRPIAWTSTNQRLALQGVSGTSHIDIGRDSGSNNLNFIIGTGSTPIAYSWSPNINQWYYLAFRRSSGTATIWIDGVQVASGSNSYNITASQMVVGGLDWASGYNANGYISQFRYSNTARTITVPTAPYTSDANTLILCGQNQSGFFDESSSFKVLSGNNGDAAVVPISPYPPSAPYDQNIHGGSVSLAEDRSFLHVGGTPSAAFCTGGTSGQTNTIEAWVYPLTMIDSTGGSSTDHEYTSIFANDSVYINWGIRDGRLAFYWYSPSNTVSRNETTGAFDVPLRQWSHVMTTVNGSTMTHYVNGVNRGNSGTTYSGVNTGGASVQNNWLGLQGAWVNDTGPVHAAFKGYISDFRISNSVRSGVPSKPLTSDSTTKELLQFKNQNYFNYAKQAIAFKPFGNCRISSGNAKWGNTSLYFDGTNSYATTSIKSAQSSVGSGDFTIEFWMNPSSIKLQTVFSQLTTVSSTDPHIYMDASGYVHYYTTGAQRIGNSTIQMSTGNWYHVAVSRASGVTRMFINGTQVGSNYTDSNAYSSPAWINWGQYMTSDGTFFTGEWYHGYIDDFRLTVGYARYTSSFGTPTQHRLF